MTVTVLENTEDYFRVIARSCHTTLVGLWGLFSSFPRSHGAAFFYEQADRCRLKKIKRIIKINKIKKLNHSQSHRCGGDDGHDLTWNRAQLAREYHRAG
jgi:hypothetical protein